MADPNPSARTRFPIDLDAEEKRQLRELRTILERRQQAPCSLAEALRVALRQMAQREGVAPQS